LKRAGEDLEHDVSKKPKPTEVPMSSQSDVPQQQATNIPPIDPQQPSDSSSQPNVSMSSGPEKRGIPMAPGGSLLEPGINDSDDDDDPVIVWSSKYFTHLREILHLVDRQDLLKLYGMVVKYYEDHPLVGAGMISA
ncbi:hypothetical protein Tco_0274450, partial [Tanacetum coccineum]